VIIWVLAVVGSITAAPAPTSPMVGLANPASTACIAAGGKLRIVEDLSGGQVGICTRKDGRQCEEWALFRTAICLLPPLLEH
jgi:hypothetical protein